jgi:hypothetical protein
LIGDHVESDHTPFGSRVYALVLRVALQAGGIPKHLTWATMIISFAYLGFMIYRKRATDAEKVLSAEAGTGISRRFFGCMATLLLGRRPRFVLFGSTSVSGT